MRDLYPDADSGGNTKQRQIPMRPYHTLMMDVIEMLIRFGETLIGFRPKTLSYLIHLAPHSRLWRRHFGVGRHPYGDAVGPADGRIDAIVPCSLSHKQGKERGKMAHSCFEIGLCIHTEWIVEESLR